jgi:hypothetical protein
MPNVASMSMLRQQKTIAAIYDFRDAPFFKALNKDLHSPWATPVINAFALRYFPSGLFASPAVFFT